MWDARLKQERAEPRVLAKRLDATRKAATTYWKWAAAGMKLRIAERVLDLAETRMAGVRRSVELGQLAPIAVTENQRLIVERQAILIDAQRVLQQAAIALSLFLRDEEGNPVVPGVEQLPDSLPLPRSPDLTLVPGDLSLALQRRPELRAQEIELERMKLQMAGSENDLLPEFDVGVAASQDYGDAVSDPDDKGPFEFDAFFRFQVPLQRRKAKGKLRQVEAKANKLQREIQFQKDQILAQVQDVSLRLTQTWARLAQIQENAALALELERAELISLTAGQSDLLRVNLREQQTAKAESSLVEVITEHFQALAEYRAFLGLTYDEVIDGRSVGE
ncbi:MAG: TolC family protein, partial [Planctomycetota bacterium]